MSTAFITHPDCLLPDVGDVHPECTERLMAIHKYLTTSGLDQRLQHYEAPLVTRQQLERVHSVEYLDNINQSAPDSGVILLDPDTVMDCHMLTAAQRAAGAVILAVDLVMRQEVSNAFCCIRPPGHHAEHEEAMGFCIYNNVAIGAAHALQEYGLARVAILDFDAHHGNGTENIFRDNPQVMLCSTFQHPFYPYQGADSSNDHIINVPLLARSDGKVFREKIEEHWLPAIARFRPELVFISAGFDGHRKDEMAQLLLEDEDYVWITQTIKTIAAEYAKNRIVSVLEGGYDLYSLGRTVAAHIQALLE